MNQHLDIRMIPDVVRKTFGFEVSDRDGKHIASQRQKVLYYCNETIRQIDPESIGGAMSDITSQSARPTPDKPLLIGLLVDVSGSMMSSMNNRAGSTQRRLESFRDALDDLVAEGRKLCHDEKNKNTVPLFRLFAYGFGFGNALVKFFGDSGPDVRDLLAMGSTTEATLSIDNLADNWNTYKSHFETLARQMFGDTPMLSAFKIVAKRFQKERQRQSLTDPPILFVLSDGEPTDGSASDILTIAQSMKSSGILVLRHARMYSCPSCLAV